MTRKEHSCLVCNCENTMDIDAEKLSAATGQETGKLHNQLCRSQVDRFEKALAENRSLTIACTQEAPLFEEIAVDADYEGTLKFFNIRENAGWSKEAGKALPKMAALLNAASHVSKPARLKSIMSDGMCLVYGSGEQSLEAAKLLSSRLSVTLLLSDNGDEPVLPAVWDIPIYRGKITRAEGSFGQFSITVDNYAPLLPSSRDSLQFAMTRDGAKSACSLLLDLSGDAPLFAGHHHRDGYKRMDPGDPAAVLRAVIELGEMAGEFEKPIYVAYNADTCAHARSRKTGCSKCLDVCPAGAISEDEDFVSIDSGICGGCGSCHAVCPTGSISYQYPLRQDFVGKVQVLLSTYLDAGGKNPVLLLHDETHGFDLIGTMARFGDGLPANVIPLGMHSVTTAGHVETLSAIASGAEQIIILADPKKTDELSGTETEGRLANEMLKGLGFGEDDRIHLLAEKDPAKAEEIIWSLKKKLPVKPSQFEALGNKREIGRLALSALHNRSKSQPEIIPLPENAPYGRVEIDRQACTLCMSCASACPTGAITDTPGEPKLRFVESACVQCSLCVKTCPENALSLVPQYNFTPTAMQPVTLYEEEPFDCVVCGTPFATRSTIDRIKAQLAGKHAMFASEEKARMIEMCDKCRVEAQANSDDDPFSSGSRPRVRTTQDYLDAESGKLTADDFLIEDD